MIRYSPNFLGRTLVPKAPILPPKNANFYKSLILLELFRFTFEPSRAMITELNDEMNEVEQTVR